MNIIRTIATYDLTPSLLKRGLKKIISEGEYIEDASGYGMKVDKTFFSPDEPNITGLSVSLYGPILKAIEEIAKGNVVYGLQKTDDDVMPTVITEWHTAAKIYGTVYSPKNGSFWGRTKKITSSMLEDPMKVGPKSNKQSSDGTELFIAILCSMLLQNEEYKYYPDEYITTLNTVMSGYANNFEKMEEIAALYRMANIIEVGIKKISTIPFSLNNSTSQPTSILSIPAYIPNYRITGDKSFEIFVEKNKSKLHSNANGKVKDIGDKYCLKNVVLTSEQEDLIPKNVDDKLISVNVEKTVRMVKYLGKKNFMFSGPAGTGKTIGAQIIAKLLGLPYRFITCDDGTEKMDLVSVMMPKSGDNLPNYSIPELVASLQMDPATIYSEITGKEYDESILYEDALAEILDLISQNKDDDKFVLVSSELVKGIQHPCVIEIQEPALIAKAGVMPALNALMDDNASVTLSDGKIINRDPNAIIVLTTNSDYKGCNDINESVLSRMDAIFDEKALSANDMFLRLWNRPKTKELIEAFEREEDVAKANALKMATAVIKTAEFVKQKRIKGGVCGYREYENWFDLYLLEDDVDLSAEETIISHACRKIDLQEEIRKNLNACTMDI